MADDIPHQQFQVKDLPTKSVTLYPSRAHVIREVRDVVLQPGQNEIELVGLTEDLDVNSVQIDGTGSATITDMTLELVPNPQTFSTAHPPDFSFSSSSESDFEDSDDDIEAVQQLSAYIKDLDAKIETEAEIQKNIEARLKILEKYCNGVAGVSQDAKSPQEMVEVLQMYENERNSLFRSNTKSVAATTELKKSKARLEAARSKAGKGEEKARARAAWERKMARDKARAVRREKFREKERLLREKEKFWPHRVYKVKLGLETSLDTPSSSRRGSIDERTLTGVPAADEKSGKAAAASITSSERTVTLSLSYVTNSAFWTPRYDLIISSPQKTAGIVYRAEFSNGTSETWKDAKIILSTSQTSYSGLDDKAPTISSWQIKLGRAYEVNSGGLLSSAELKGPRQQHAVLQQQSKANYMSKSSANGHKNVFNSYEQASIGGSGQANSSVPTNAGGLFGSNNSNAFAAQPPPPPPAMMLRSKRSSVSAAPPPPPPGAAAPRAAGLFGSSRRRGASELVTETYSIEENEATTGASTPEEAAGAGLSGLDFEESVWEDSGLTANYELPGLRTLTPSSIARRHKIASLTATNIHLSYVCVPKLRSAAFLKARIRNPSSTVTLLKGTAGVTLDGSFLGNMSLPRVSPLQTFNLPLGVDPAIHISYPKPNVHRSTQGIFNRESAQIFSRSIWLSNTKSAPVELTVLDQVPISQDDRLRVNILKPKGLGSEGDSVRAGQAAKEGGKEVVASGSASDKAWGKATATLKKDGEVSWSVNMEKSAACLLQLEYEARMPSGETIVEVSA